eukprot:3743069-Karenia_brevis.AAC.1
MVGPHSHATPELFDLFDADAATDVSADHASPVLIDAFAQTEISTHKSWPDRFDTINEDGHASPVVFD